MTRQADMERQSTAPAAVSLSTLVTRLGNALRMNPDLRGAWVTAELSDVRQSGGHCYMELIEKDVFGNTSAKLRAVVWRSSFEQLRGKFFRATGRDIASGIKVMVRGSVTHHNLYGLSFTIDDIDPSYTLGDLERLRREILERLQREGVLELNRRLPLPEAPQRIAVISAANAAGYGDFINQISHNPAGAVTYTMLFPAVMQGERTSQSVRAALDLIEQTIDMWDCVAIVRGGGSTTDLNGFDDYELARRVATFPLPVVVGIGHERDRTVLDEIACVRCKTPTAVAAWITDRLSQAAARVEQLMTAISRYAADNVRGETRRLDHLSASLPQLVKMKIMKATMRLERIMSGLGAKSAARISREQTRLRESAARLPLVAASSSEREKRRLDHIEGMLRVLSPQSVLSRGYSVTRCGGKAVTSASQLMPGARIVTTLADGTVESEVV